MWVCFAACVNPSPDDEKALERRFVRGVCVRCASTAVGQKRNAAAVTVYRKDVLQSAFSPLGADKSHSPDELFSFLDRFRDPDISLCALCLNMRASQILSEKF